MVEAARAALATNDVGRVLPYVPLDGEAEVVDAFDLAMKVRALGAVALEVAYRWFFETVVRIHRAGEAAPFTGLKPAGLDVGPVIPAAERALESGAADELAEVLCGEIRGQVERRLAHASELRGQAEESIPHARAYVTAMLGLQVWAHGVHRHVIADPHPHAEDHAHG